MALLPIGCVRFPNECQDCPLDGRMRTCFNYVERFLYPCFVEGRKERTNTPMVRNVSPQTIQFSTPSVKVCPACQEFVGRSYPDCVVCREVVEEPIGAAWLLLLHAQESALAPLSAQQLAAHVLAHSEIYWWSEVEAAMRLTACPLCHGPLGYGATDCAECIWNSDLLWGRDFEVSPEGTICRNEHAFRVILRGLSQAHRHSPASIEGWRLFLPFLLHGPQPVGTKDERRYAQAINAWIKAGRGPELAVCQSIEQMYAMTRRGRK